MHVAVIAGNYIFMYFVQSNIQHVSPASASKALPLDLNAFFDHSDL